MPTKTVLTSDPATLSNAQIMNAVRMDSSREYQQRVPAVTQGNISEAVAVLQNYRPAMNEFADQLVNRIGDVWIKSKIWTNPLAQFKRGMMQYGDTMEEIFVNIRKGKAWDPNECYEDVFKCSKPDIRAIYHSIDRQDMYELTLTDILLNRAFTNEYGLTALMSNLLEEPYNRDYYDEYLIMRNLFTEYARNDWFYKVQVPAMNLTDTFDTTRTNAAKISQLIRTYADKLTFRSEMYNATGVSSFTPKSDLVLFATPEFNAALDTHVIAYAFNVSATDVPTRVVTVDDFGIDGCQAILCDRDFFVCADTLIDFESIRNPKQISWNYFLHHHGIYSASLFVNAIMFTTEAGTSVSVPQIKTTGVTVDYATPENGTKPTFVEKGGKVLLTASVAGTVTPQTDGYVVPQGVMWQITDTSGKPMKDGTYVDANGWLHCDMLEENTYVTVTATQSYVDPATSIASQTFQQGTLNVGIGKVYTPSE